MTATDKQAGSSASPSLEAQLFQTADKLRGNMEPSDYKHVGLGLIFLKHISDSFEAKRAELLADYPEGAEDRDEYLAENVFWVPATARWSHLRANAKQPTIGRLVDEAVLALEQDNPSLRGVLPKDYARPALNAVMLGEEEGLSADEVAFYDALAENGSAVEVMGNDLLRVIANELLANLKQNITVDWSQRENARARLRVLVKRILRKHGYPPALQDGAVRTVLQQAEVLSGRWAA